MFFDESEVGGAVVFDVELGVRGVMIADEDGVRDGWSESGSNHDD